eukprot:5272670-Prorocentrum_lima.AAC.1
MKSSGVHLYERDSAGYARCYSPFFDLYNKGQVWNCVVEVFANNDDLINKEGPKTDGLVFPGES